MSNGAGSMQASSSHTARLPNFLVIGAPAPRRGTSCSSSRPLRLRLMSDELQRDLRRSLREDVERMRRFLGEDFDGWGIG
jgi:hypothetical protein